MAESHQITAELIDAFETACFHEVEALVQKGLDERADPTSLVNDGMVPGIRAVGEQFRRGEVYLPEMMMAADAFQEGMDILQPIIARAGTEREAAGTVVVATVKGDIHALGKNIVVTMLKTEGFNVIDAGVDIPASKIIDEAEKWNVGPFSARRVPFWAAIAGDPKARRWRSPRTTFSPCWCYGRVSITPSPCTTTPRPAPLET